MLRKYYSSQSLVAKSELHNKIILIFLTKFLLGKVREIFSEKRRNLRISGQRKLHCHCHNEGINDYQDQKRGDFIENKNKITFYYIKSYILTLLFS